MTTEEDERDRSEFLRPITARHVRAAIEHYQALQKVQAPDVWDDFIQVTATEQGKITDVIAEHYSEEEGPLVSEGVLIGILAVGVARDEG